MLSLHMSTDIDRADAEVKGLARLLPTTLVKSLLVTVFALPIAAFQVVRGNPEWFWLSSLPSIEQSLIAVIVGLLFSWLPLAGLVLELCVVVGGAKHRRIVHYANEHPLGSFRWLKANARASHYLAAAAWSAVVFLAGFYVART
jgi:hypothetical protein